MTPKTWSQLLDYCSGPLLDDRSLLLEGATDSEFSDEEILAKMEEAQDILADEAWCIKDSTTVSTGSGPTLKYLCQYPIANNQRVFDLHPSVLWVERAKFSDTDLWLSRATSNEGRTGSVIYEGNARVPFAYTENPGRPNRFETQSDPTKLYVAPKIDITQFDGTVYPIQQGPTPAVLQLEVYRLPILPVDGDNLDAEPEVPAEFHLALAEYAAGSLLTLSQSAEAEAKRTGERLMKSWNATLARAKRKRQRQVRTPSRYRFGAWVTGARRSW